MNSALLLLLYCDYKELSEVRLPLSLGTRKAHRQDTLCFDLVSISVDKGREEGHVCDPDFAEGEWGR